MPVLFALDQHPALVAIQRRSMTSRVQTPWGPSWVFVCEQELWRHGKTHIWKLAGMKPDIYEELQRLAEVAKPGARVWRGSELSTEEQGIKVSCGTQGFHQHLEKVLEQHQVLLNGIPRVPDLQSAWLILLHCASARANYQLRVMRPEVVLEFAAAHDENLWRCLCGHDRLWPVHFLASPFWANPFWANPFVAKIRGAPKGGGPELWGPRGAAGASHDNQRTPNVHI